MKKDKYNGVYDADEIDDEIMDDCEDNNSDDEEETEFEALDELCKEEIEQVKNEVPLTEENLQNDLKKKCEADRRIYNFSKGGVQYRGYVLTKFGNDAYIFNVEDSNSSTGHTIKKFRTIDIETLD